MRAYFDDGTIITCPRCAFTKKMLRIFKVTFQTSQYKHMNLKMMELADGWKHEYPYVNKNENYEGWAMINYKWFVDYK
jgi:glutaredoxin